MNDELNEYGYCPCCSPKEETKGYYEDVKREWNNTTNPTKKKVRLAVMNVYAGFYNNDKKLILKGMRQYKKYSIEYLDEEIEKGLTTEVSGLDLNDDGEFELYKNEEWIRRLGIALKKDYEFYEMFAEGLNN
jgi:hypothetical protein